MPNHVTNTLKIHCEDTVTMDKIRMMIIEKDEDKNQIFTMQKMLPIPERFSGREGYSDYGYDWCRAIWGTKWDLYDCIIKDSRDTIIINYRTAWNPNENFIELLCLYTQKSLGYSQRDNPPKINVNLNYYDYMGDFGGVFEWTPFKNPTRKSYSFLEYAKNHNKKLYEWDLEMQKLRSGVE